MRSAMYVALCIFLSLFVAQGAVTTQSPASCATRPADIHFLLDASGSVGATNFEKQKQFIATFAKFFTIGSQNVEIGVTTFSSTVHHQFYMNKYNNKTALVAAINAIPFLSGGTATDAAITWVDQNAFSKEAGDRDHVVNILIVMTDGQSANPPKTAAAATTIHSHNIKTFAIGIGTGINQVELQHIATDNQHVFTVQNFDALHTLQAELLKNACTASFSTTTLPKASSSTTTQPKEVTLVVIHRPNQDFCSSHPCQNNSRCIHDLVGYLCLCDGGFTGKYCEIDICQTHPCHNNGRCLEDSQGYVCICDSGFTGQNCDTSMQDLSIVGKK